MESPNPATKTYTTAHGLSSNAVYAIKGDRQDNLWISTNAGMSRFNLNTHVQQFLCRRRSAREMNSAKRLFCRPQQHTLVWRYKWITYFNPQEITESRKKMERTHHRLLSARPAHKERECCRAERNHKHLRLWGPRFPLVT